MTNRTIGWLFAAGALAVLGWIAFNPIEERLDSRNGDNPVATETQTSEPSELAASNEVQARDSAGLEAGEPVSEFEKIDGLMVRKDRNCTVTTYYIPKGDGTVTPAHACVPNTPATKHEYESYSYEALLSLAYADAKAAEILGLRLREDDEESAMSLVIRASALSGGDVSPLQKYSNYYPHASSIDGVPVLKTIHVKYVLAAVSEILGAEFNNLEMWRHDVLSSSGNPDATLRQLDAQVDQIIAQMRAIQIEVFGEATIGGDDDA